MAEREGFEPLPLDEAKSPNQADLVVGQCFLAGREEHENEPN